MAYVREDLKPGYTGNFVIHDHKAERAHHHWDLRLEFPVTSVAEALGTYGEKRPAGQSPEPSGARGKGSGTVLRSWAVPKHHPPTDRPVLATETEDHAIEYATFKGTIPKGEYGAGEVDIYDHGTYKLLDAEYDKKYVVKFEGKKLKGVYALIKTHGKQFLWTKVKDATKYKLSSLLRGCAASIIDYVRPHMLETIWDLGTPIKLKEKVRKALLDRLFKTLKNSDLPDPDTWISGVILVGSVASYNYKEDGDLDIDVMYRPEAILSRIKGRPVGDLRRKIQEVLRRNKDVKVPGTNLTYSYLAFPEGEGSRSDGAYDVINDKWIKGPIRIPEEFDPDSVFKKEKMTAREIMVRIYALISNIMATLKDLKRIDQYTQEYDDRLKMKKQTALIVLRKLCMDLVEWRRKIWALQENPDPSAAKYPAYNFSPDWNERNVIFKYLARYGGHEPIYYLYNLLKNNPYLDTIKSFMPEDAIGDVLKDKIQGKA